MEKFSEAELTRLLERAPAVDVPAEFAAKVRARLPAARPARRAASVGQTVAIVCAVVIALALFMVAPHAQGNVLSFGFWMEMLLLVELGGIAYWLSKRQLQ